MLHQGIFDVASIADTDELLAKISEGGMGTLQGAYGGGGKRFPKTAINTPNASMAEEQRRHADRTEADRFHTRTLGFEDGVLGHAIREEDGDRSS